MIARRWTHLATDERGSTLAIVLITVVMLSALALSLSSHTLMARRVQEQDLDLDRAAYVARAGFERTCAEVLLGSNDWSSLTPAVFVAEGFASGSFDVSLLGLSQDAATVRVLARSGVAERSLEFSALRESDGSGVTTGARLTGLTDLTLSRFDQE